MAGNSSPPSSPKGVHHKKQDVYSEQLPIPSIQRFFKKGLAEVITREEDSESSEEDEQQHQKQKTSSEKKPKDDIKSEDTKHPEVEQQSKRRSHKSRIVDDPVTGGKVAIHDVGKKEYKRAMEDAEEAQNQSTSRKSNGERQSGDSGRKGDSFKGVDTNSKERHGKEAPKNVLQMPFPPDTGLPPKLWNVHPLLLPLFVVWSAVTAFRLVHPLISVAFMTWLAWWGFRTIHVGIEDRRWDQERKRGQGASRGYYADQLETKEEQKGESRPMHGIMESAEWLNSVLESLWSVMNSDLFSSLGSTLEDVLQASTNGQAFIQAVKVEDLAQGSTPLRLTGFRVLGDEEAVDLRKAAQKAMRERQAKEKKVYMPQEEKDTMDNSSNDIPNADDEEQAQKGGKPGNSAGGKAIDDDTGGSFMNLELSFVYRARPTSGTVASKSRNAHLLIKFWVGAKKWYTVPLPVWVEILGLVGTVRVRVQLTPDPPFIKNVTFSLMGLPRTSVQVIPLRVNTQNLPFLSDFIQSSIDAAVGEYCAPSSMTIDVGEALMGDSIKREVNAIGVVIIYIHRAFELEKQDVRGSSDPYCTLSLAKQGKIQYCTRVAVNDLSPRWEETTSILISPEAVRAKEKVSISLWDSDRFSADDMLGSASVDLQALVRRPGRMFRRLDTLVGLTEEMKKQGTIQWSVGYFKKASNRRRWNDKGAREREEEEVQKMERDGGDEVNVKEEEVEKDMHVLDQEEPDLELAEDEGQQTRNMEQASGFEPPSPLTPSGILSLQIHQIAQLELVDTRTHISSRKDGEPGQKVETVEDQQDQPTAPSSYVTIVLNDETVFRSRSKALNNNPFFNAGSERFVRDWRRALVMFVVWDSRQREQDAILGVVPIKLSDIFKETSQVTQFFPIAGGVGKGRIRLSLLFRPVEDTNRHKEKLGWSIGTLRILSSLTATDFEQNFSSTTLRLVSIRARTLAGRAHISSRRCSLTEKDESKSVEWRVEKEEMPIKVPVRRRYAAPFIIEFRALTALGMHKTVAVSIVWLQDVADDDVVDEKLPIWKPKEGHDYHRLLQNYHNYKNEKEAEELGVERVGYLYVKLQFKSGVGKIHTKFGKSNPDAKDVMQAWECCTAMGLRSVTGDFVARKSEDRESNNLGTEEDSDGDDSGSDEEGNERGEEGDESDGDEDEQGIIDKFRKWSEERKELHRQHRGIKQYKVARTASWLGKGVRESGSRAINSLKLQDRRSGQVESEL